MAVEALSRVKGAEILCLAISSISSDLEDKIRISYEMDPHMIHIRQHLNDGMEVKHYTARDPDADLRKAIMAWHHASIEAGHLGRDVTVMRIKRIFYLETYSEGHQEIYQRMFCVSSCHE